MHCSLGSQFLASILSLIAMTQTETARQPHTHETHNAHINAAVESIIECCMNSRSNAHATYARCMGDLVDDSSWSIEDIGEVKIAVLHWLDALEL